MALTVSELIAARFKCLAIFMISLTTVLFSSNNAPSKPDGLCCQSYKTAKD